MKELRLTMHQFFSSFENLHNTDPSPISAYPEGYAVMRNDVGDPTNPPMPYITYPLVKQEFGTQSYITANIWNRVSGNPGHFELVDHVLGQFRERFSGGRIVLQLGDGRGGIVLQLNRIGYMDDPDDQDITRGIMQMVIKDFIP